MKVVLVHNPASGSEKHTERKLIKQIRRAGHEVICSIEDSRKLPAILVDGPCDAVLVAGGDGTVGRAACAVADFSVPLAILPLGTANNTAATLGIRLELELEHALDRLSGGKLVPFDIALLDDGNVRQRFCEATGWGVFVQTMLAAERRAKQRHTGRQLEQDRALWIDIATRAKPREYGVQIDGQDHSGTYLMLEVLNVPLLGPRLWVSPHGNASDGQLEVVMVPETEREALVALASGSALPEAPLPYVRGREVRIRAREGALHRDGSLWRHPEGTLDFAVRLQARGVHYIA
jgi:diacylglycerol kinase family enzyme